ncbi:MAG: SDR family oxidoreductase [Pseudomonadota bacterium]
MTYKAALVTGAGGRIGREIAIRLAQQKISVAVHYANSADGAEETADLIRAAGGTAKTIQADLLDDKQTLSLIENAASSLGCALDVLVNNASIFEYDNILTASVESWNKHMATNLKGPLFLTQAFAAQASIGHQDEFGEPLAKASVINLIDQRVRKITPEFLTYSVAKSGLWSLTQMTAQALAPHIRVNGIGPGPTVQGHRQSAEHFEKQRASTILQRGSSASEIADTVEFLLKSHAITGQLLCLDGGQHLGWQTPDVLGVE